MGLLTSWNVATPAKATGSNHSQVIQDGTVSSYTVALLTIDAEYPVDPLSSQVFEDQEDAKQGCRTKNREEQGVGHAESLLVFILVFVSVRVQDISVAK